MSEPFIGEIKMFTGNFAPKGWAFCNGALLPISNNQVLFAIIGTNYGGDGRTTFGLPDLRGRSPVGANTRLIPDPGPGPNLQAIALGQKSGGESVSLLTSQLPVHTPEVTVTVEIPASTAVGNGTDSPSETAVLAPGSSAGRPVNLYTSDAADTSLKPFNATANIKSLGGGSPVDIRNPYQGVSFIIAVEGIFPPHS
ncbi:tail fiber protein [Shewanella vesiculosa]|uniref:Tail fiber protein n=1 Tax=Shewanella vesiculosa TaxID=518738 RepID=A0ABV0FTQ0_9GAMM|tara:strand:- start:518 stop:1108 length:591 start_codon:yes stop_codon:yes gene_type:complete